MQAAQYGKKSTELECQETQIIASAMSHEKQGNQSINQQTFIEPYI